MTTKVVTFHTFGPPRDDALPLEGQMLTTKWIVEKAGFEFLAYSPDVVRALGEEGLVRPYPDQYRLPHNPGAHRVGLFAWKPFIIRDALNGLEDGNSVFFVDCNLGKWPQYHEKLRNIGNLTELASKVGDFFVARELVGQRSRIKHHASNSQIRLIGGNSEFTRNFPLLIVNNIVCRKSPAALDVLEEWLELCRMEECILPPVDGDHDPEFRWFSPEQAILNLIIAKRVEKGLLPSWYPGLSIGRGFDPRPTDNSHLADLPALIPRLAGGLGYDRLAWRTAAIELDDWRPAEGARLRRQPDGTLVLADGVHCTYHLLRVARPEFGRAWVRLRVVARALPGCNAALNVQHWGGVDIASYRSDGRLLLQGLAVETRAVLSDDGWMVADTIFPNMHETVSFGLGDPSGRYKGEGRDQYEIREVAIQYAPID